MVLGVTAIETPAAGTILIQYTWCALHSVAKSGSRPRALSAPLCHDGCIALPHAFAHAPRQPLNAESPYIPRGRPFPQRETRNAEHRVALRLVTATLSFCGKTAFDRVVVNSIAGRPVCGHSKRWARNCAIRGFVKHESCRPWISILSRMSVSVVGSSENIRVAHGREIQDTCIL